MRYLILSDIHANIEALEAVLLAAPPSLYDRVLVLGDLVGYGADPNAVVDRVRALDPALVIRGNHDKASCGLDDASSFNQLARTAAQWTYETLTEANREYLRQLPQGPIVVSDLLEVCHGAPFDEDVYIFDGDDARRALDITRRPLCLFGHTHLPVAFFEGAQGLEAIIPDEENTVITMTPERKYLINPGSVGQPRDGDARAAVGLLDESRKEVTVRRVAYPVDAAQEKILAAGLPRTLAVRLAMGR